MRIWYRKKGGEEKEGRKGERHRDERGKRRGKKPEHW
jgi:hypothetical protein